MSTQDTTFEEEVRTAHLDSAHVGDIQGAWGTIRASDTAPRKTWVARLITLLVIMGPGLVTMVGDNDAGGVATYTQAGQNYVVNSANVGSPAILTLLVNPLSGIVEPLEGRDPRWGRKVTVEPSYNANDIDSSSNAHML